MLIAYNKINESVGSITGIYRNEEKENLDKLKISYLEIENPARPRLGWIKGTINLETEQITYTYPKTKDELIQEQLQAVGQQITSIMLGE